MTEVNNQTKKIASGEGRKGAPSERVERRERAGSCVWTRWRLRDALLRFNPVFGREKEGESEGGTVNYPVKHGSPVYNRGNAGIGMIGIGNLGMVPERIRWSGW